MMNNLPPSGIKRYLALIAHYLWVIFFNGFLTLLPFTLTIALFTFSFRLINNWLEPIYNWEPEFIQVIPGSAVIVVLLFIFIVGFLVKHLFLEPLVHAVEALFFKIPLMSQVYSGMKQLVHAFTAKDEGSFQQVVMVPFPYGNGYSIGFLTTELPDWVNHQHTAKLYNVFIPTTPNPTSGFLIQIPEDRIIRIPLSRQEAMSLIISGGIIKPERTTSS